MIHFKIVTPHGTIYDDVLAKATIPTEAGIITLLENHAPLVSVLVPGELTLHKQDGSIINLAVSGGIVEMRPTGELYIMADTAEREQDIDLARAEEARLRAEELLKQAENLADVDFARIQAALEKELARLHVGKKYKNIKL